MTITRRDSNFFAGGQAPGKTADLINNFASSLDENVLNVFKALAVDIDIFKASLDGITRRDGRFEEMLFVYNNPTQKNIGPQEAARMDKYGNIAIGTEYPRWPRCKVDVNGPVYAIPQWGLWSKSTTDAAGAGLYAWNVEVYNPNSDIYSRTAGNTGIRIDEPGTYDFRGNIFVQDTVAATGTNIVVQIVVNGTAVVSAHTPLMTNDLAHVHLTRIGNINRGDVVGVNLVLQATSQKYGDVGTSNTFIQICKVN